MKEIAVFDFDGTLTTKDTLLEFIKYSCGTKRFYTGFLMYAPMLILMKLHLYPNWKAKEKVLAHFFKGWKYEDFADKGRQFADIVDSVSKEEGMKHLMRHQQHGDVVYVISGSVEEWVRPWCERHGVTHVLGTQMEVGADCCLTGRLLSKNCYGQEKVNRLLEVEPERNSYELFAYGNSNGDREMLVFADKGVLL